MQLNSRKQLFLAIAPFIFLKNVYFAHEKYQIQPVVIQILWAKFVSPTNGLKGYPRPQLVRNNWTDLDAKVTD